MKSDSISSPDAPRPKPVGHRGRARLLAFLLAAGAAGCGYTVLERRGASPSDSEGAVPPDSLSWSEDLERARERGGEPDSLAGEDRSSARDEEDELLLDERRLPPGHPPLTPVEEWIGTSFVDHLVGENDPFRFENLRRNPHSFAPAHHALITVRMTLGGPAVADIWQVRMDQFGWVTASYWMQGAAGPTLDELNATYRTEFRLERQSEAALRAMVIELLPKTERTSLSDLPQLFRALPPGWWPYSESGLLEIEYHLESLGLVDPSDWPGGTVSARLDLIQLLIGTWDGVPAPELRRDVRWLIDRHPGLLNIALIAEAVVLASEVEGAETQSIELPLRVGR